LLPAKGTGDPNATFGSICRRVLSALILTSTLVRADGYERPYVAPPGIGIDWEVGARYWYSTGHYKKEAAGTVQLSRPTYDELRSSAPEAFFRGDIWVFLRKGHCWRRLYERAS